MRYLGDSRDGILSYVTGFGGGRGDHWNHSARSGPGPVHEQGLGGDLHRGLRHLHQPRVPAGQGVAAAVPAHHSEDGPAGGESGLCPELGQLATQVSKMLRFKQNIVFVSGRCQPM